MDEKLKEENIDYLYTEFQRELCALEDKRDALTREIGKIDEGQELLDDIYTEMRWIFREASEHCDEESFLRIMDEYEDDFYDCRRTVENELEEKKELLETEKSNSYREEEDLRDEFQRVKRNC